MMAVRPIRSRALVLLAAAVLVTSVSACTGGDDPDGVKTSSSSSSGTASTGTARDASADVLGFTLPDAAGSVTARVKPPGAPELEVTFSVGEVKASETSTLVTFWYTFKGEPGKSKTAPLSVLDSTGYPSIIDNGAKKAYHALTFDDYEGFVACVCSQSSVMYPEPHPMQALYPPLPDGLSEVSVKASQFPAVKVPVTR